MLRATVSGSFHRHMSAIYDAVGSLRVAGVDVLSPADPRVVANIGEFLFVASDKLRSVRLVQDRHLEAIRASDFLWVVCPDGYTGPSTSGEIMAAAVLGVPVFADSPAHDITIGQYVRCVPTVHDAISAATIRRTRPAATAHVLIDPSDAIERAHVVLDTLDSALNRRFGDGMGTAEAALKRARETTSTILGLPL